MPFFEIRLAGTPAGSGGYQVFFENGTGIPGVKDETFTNSVFVRLSAGSMTGVSNIRLALYEYNSSSTYLTGGTADIAVTDALPSVPQAYTRKLTDAATVYVMPRLQFNLVLSVAVDMTFRVYMPQCEKAAKASSRIATSGSSVTRAKDNPYTTDLSWFNPNEGTLFVSASTDAADNTCVMAEFNDNSWNNRISSGIIFVGSLLVYNVILTGGVTQDYGIVDRASTTDAEHRVARSWKTNQLFLARNGVSGTSVTTASIPTGITHLKFGDAASGAPDYTINGTLRAFKYWNRALSDNDLKRITT
jgi:hypothetical protein